MLAQVRSLVVINPIAELRAFFTAALVSPVERDHQESDEAFRRRRLVSLVTLMAGAVVLAATLRIAPGDPLFYAASAGLAVVWALGAWASGPLHLGFGHTRTGSMARPVVQSLALGTLLLAIFVAGALIVAQIPFLRDPVQGLLDHARFGSLPLVFLLTTVNGIAEECYFRGALYSAVGRRHAVLVTTAVYVAVTAASGIALLAFAAAVLGTVTGLQRRVTGGILGPVVTHLMWSLGMLLVLPPLLDRLS